MSTRSMTVLRQSKRGATIYLYRHCDGYPAVAGCDLAAACPSDLNRYASAADVARNLLAMRYPKQPHDTEARGVYELADWTPAEQGDLEHVYHVLVTEQAGSQFWHEERVAWDGKDQFRKTYYPSLAEFREAMQAHARRMEARMAEIAAGKGGAA